VGGIPSMLPESAKRFLIAPGDVKKLTALLKELSLDPESRKRYGMELQGFYAQNFTGKIVFDKIADFYRTLLKSRDEKHYS